MTADQYRSYVKYANTCLLGKRDYPRIFELNQADVKEISHSKISLAAATHEIEEVLIALGWLYLVEQKLHGLDFIHAVE